MVSNPRPSLVGRRAGRVSGAGAAWRRRDGRGTGGQRRDL